MFKISALRQGQYDDMRKTQLNTIKAFTLMEVIITTVIIGILTTISIIGISVTKERALDNEAIQNLRLIHAWEGAYESDERCYWPCDGSVISAVGQINENLRLSLSVTNWVYEITGDNTSFTARAFRRMGDNVGLSSGRWERSFKVAETVAEPCCCVVGSGVSNACPSMRCAVCP